MDFKLSKVILRKTQGKSSQHKENPESATHPRPPARPRTQADTMQSVQQDDTLSGKALQQPQEDLDEQEEEIITVSAMRSCEEG